MTEPSLPLSDDINTGTSTSASASADAVGADLKPQQNLRLIHLSGSLNGKQTVLDPGEHSMGRHADSEVRYDHAADFLVSTRHGRVVHESGHWYIEDLGSTNGTWVDG